MRDLLNLLESINEPLVLKKDGSNEDEFLKTIQSIDGKVMVTFDSKLDMFVVQPSPEYATEENEDFRAYIPDAYYSSEGSLMDVEDAGRWLYQHWCNVSGF